MVDLTHIELATEEDKVYEIDRWARLFKSTTWEEIKMIAENNPVFMEASESLYVLNADELARQRSRAREENILHENALNRKITKLTEDNAALIFDKQKLISENERLRAKLSKYETLDS